MNGKSNAGIWVTFKQAAELIGIRRSRLYSRKESFRTRPSANSRNGKPGRLEFLLSSLPEAAQLRYQEQLSKEIVVAERKIQSGAPDPPRAGRERGDVPERFRAIVQERLRSIQGLIDFGLHPERGKRNGFSLLAKAEGLKYGVSGDVMERRFERYRRLGEAGLAPKLREDEGESRFFKRHPKAAAFCQAKALSENLSTQLVWLALEREWAALGEVGKVPSYNTVLHYLENTIRPDVAILAREGKREYMRIAVPTIIRDSRGIAANDWWVLDHRVHDVFVYNEVFPADVLEPLKMYRPWMSLTWDWGSRKVVGVIWAPTPSSRTINASLRMAVAECGLPRNFYWDNGKDFQSVGRVLMSDQLSGILKANAVEITNALPFNPRSKPIEPFFQFFAYQFDPKFGPG